MTRVIRVGLALAGFLAAQVTMVGPGRILGPSQLGGVASGGGGGSVTFVQAQNTGDSTCGNSCTIVLTSAPGNGNIVVFSAKWQGSGTTISSVTETGATCTLLSATLWTDGTNNDAGESGTCSSISSGSATITFNMSAGTFHWLGLAAEYSGQAASAVDTSSGASVNCAGTSCNAPSVTTTANGDMIVSTIFEYSGNSASLSAGSGTGRTGLANFSELQDQTQASSGAITPNFTTSAAAGVSGLATIAIKHS